MKMYSPKITPRLLYMANWAGNYLFGKPMEVITSLERVEDGEFILNYSPVAFLSPSFQIVPSGLLDEAVIRPQNVDVLVKGNLIRLFPTGGSLGFDILSAVFYLVSRYEEYLPHEKDSYGRYAHISSLAYKYGFLNRPLVDEWMAFLRENLQAIFPALSFAESHYRYLPTYDIDIAWSIKNKGVVRTLAGFIKEGLSGNIQHIKDRVAVLTGKKPDPFYVFEELDQLHLQYKLNPAYFILLAKRPAGYDKNISPDNKQNRELLGRISKNYKTGLHLSWKAAESVKEMNEEASLYKTITGEMPSRNRMHYINFHLPGTYEKLLSIGIKEDFSMGYGSINGFRASTCRPFKWYNLATESSTDLLIYPFCYMEANSIFEQKDDPVTGLAEMEYFQDTIKKLGGIFISIFHNHLVGLSKQGRAWMKIYRCFLEKVAIA